MSAFLDSLTDGGYDGSADGGIGDSSGAYYAQSPVGANYDTGVLQSLMSLGTGYLNKRLDIDLQTRVAASQPMPRLGTTQNPLGGYGAMVRNPATGQQYATLNLSAILPILVVGVVAFMLARRG